MIKRLIGFLFKALAWMIYALPWPVQRLLGDALGLFWFDVLRIRRQVVLNNLSIAFPELNRNELVRLGRKSMREFGRGLIQYTWLPFLYAPDRQFVYFGFENVQSAMAKGKGVLLLSLHLGQGDLGIAGLALRGLPVYVVSKLFKTKWLNDMWFGMRARCGAQFIPPRNSSYAVLKALKKGGAVVFVHDQFTGPPIGIKNTFFGRETGTGLGLALMAERSGAPVVPAYTIRNHKGQIEIHLEPEVPFVHLGDHDQSLAHMTQVYTDLLESYVRKCPEQWMWLHKRWKTYKY